MQSLIYMEAHSRWRGAPATKFFKEIATNGQSDEVRRKGCSVCGTGRVGGVRTAQPHQPQPELHSQVERQATAQVLSEREAPAGLAAYHRLALPQVRSRDPQADHRRQAAA